MGKPVNTQEALLRDPKLISFKIIQLVKQSYASLETITTRKTLKSKFVSYETKVRESFSESTAILRLLPELTEEHRIQRVTHNSVCKGPGWGCIAPGYRRGQDRLPEQTPGLSSLKDIQRKENLNHKNSGTLSSEWPVELWAWWLPSMLKVLTECVKYKALNDLYFPISQTNL